MSAHVYTTEEEVKTPESKRHHVVVLGAGASLAAFPNGERNGRKLPVLNNFVQTLGLDEVLANAGIEPPYANFEGIYSDIAAAGNQELLSEIEYHVEEYFSGLRLPEVPTLYDHLVLSLREKDVIATFNWDPFLWNAAARNRHFSPPPCILFLHGSVATAYCSRCKIVLCRGTVCHQCGRELTPSPLLYPIKQKNYQKDPAIFAHWQTLRDAMKTAWTITFFGYGAPNTDVEAIRLLKEGWGDPENRLMEETEIIDIRSQDDLTKTWSGFIHSHHFQIHASFYESNIATHPRRTCEALWQQLAMARFLEHTEFPKNADFPNLYKWLEPRICEERY